MSHELGKTLEISIIYTCSWRPFSYKLTPTMLSAHSYSSDDYFCSLKLDSSCINFTRVGSRGEGNYKPVVGQTYNACPINYLVLGVVKGVVVLEPPLYKIPGLRGSDYIFNYL